MPFRFNNELPIIRNPRSGFPMFDQPPDTPPIRPQDIREAIGEDAT